MGKLIYITHPNVDIDPLVPVPEWGLSSVGRDRLDAMLRQPWITSIDRVVCSAENKAIEAASVLASHRGLTPEVRADSGETDRSATGFVPHDEHERLADQFFADPAVSANGWERAIDAQRRIVAALADVVAAGDENVAVVGHGAVGTLLLCHLEQMPIDRCHDQPGQGHFWTYDRRAAQIEHRWHPIDL